MGSRSSPESCKITKVTTYCKYNLRESGFWRFGPSFLMGRLHSPGKGISASTTPYRRTAPHWLQLSAENCVQLICDYAKKGVRPSQIGALLRDRHSVGKVQTVTGNKIQRILRANAASTGSSSSRAGSTGSRGTTRGGGSWIRTGSTRLRTRPHSLPK